MDTGGAHLKTVHQGTEQNWLKIFTLGLPCLKKAGCKYVITTRVYMIYYILILQYLKKNIL